MRPGGTLGAMLRMLVLLLCSMLCLHAGQARSAYNTTAQQQPDKLHVHFITHEHLSGMRANYAEIYRNTYADRASKHIPTGAEAMFDSVLSALLDNPDRTFTCSELAHFVKWWQQLHPQTQAAVRQLVQQGKWEFVNGGLVQHDQVNSHYSAMLDQMTLGMRFLQRELGVRPKVAWATDGFGHPATAAALLAAGGFTAAFHGSADQADVQHRQATRAVERIWRSTPPSCPTAAGCDMLTVDFSTSFWCHPAPRTPHGATAADPDCAVNMVLQQELNAGSRASGKQQQQQLQQLVEHIVAQAQLWSSYSVAKDDVMFVVRTNFSTHTAYDWYSSLDRLVQALNADGRVAAGYSTPTRYLQAKQQAAGKLRWPLQEVGDVLPVSLDGRDYWSGLYSSRPAFKGAVRKASALLQAAQQLEVLSEALPSSQKVAASTGLALLQNQQSISALARSVVTQQSSRMVPAGGDTALLEFALALAHSHSGISGMHVQAVDNHLMGRLRLGVERAAGKLLLSLHELLYPGTNYLAAPGPTTAAAAGATTGWPALLASRWQQQLLHNSGGSSSRSSSRDSHTVGHQEQQLFGREAAAAADAETLSVRKRRLAVFDGALQRWQQLVAAAAGLGSATQQQQQQAAAAGPPLLRLCLLLNESICTASAQLSSAEAVEPTSSSSWLREGSTTAKGFLVVVYNPLPWSYTWGIRVPVGRQAGVFKVQDPSGATVPSQLVPLVHQGRATFWHGHENAALRETTKAELALQVSAPPLGHAVYKVTSLPAATRRRKPPKGASESSTETRLMHTDKPVRLSTGRLGVLVSPAIQGVAAVTVNGQTLPFSGSFIKYSSSGAGACCVRADGVRHEIPPKAGVTIVRGQVLQEVREVYDSQGTVVTRLWAGSDSLEVEWTVGPAAASSRGKDAEVLLRYETGMPSGVLYTDANGREWQRRRLGQRPSLSGGLFQVATSSSNDSSSSSNSLSGNLFPAAAGFGIRGPKSSVFVATDRPQGVASLHSGQMDVLLQRSTARDDGRGLQQPLTDDSVIVGQHIVSFSDAGKQEKGEAQQQQQQQQRGAAGGLTTRHHQQILSSPLLLAFSPLPDLPYAATSTAVAPALSGSSAAGRVSITSLKWLSCDTLLLRLSHVFQSGEHPELSTAVEVQLGQLLTSLKIVGIREAALFGERALTEEDLMGSTRADWHTAPSSASAAAEREQQWPAAAAAEEEGGGGSRPGNDYKVGLQDPATVIKLQPMQIRAFFVVVQRQHSACLTEDDGLSFTSPGGASASAQSTAAAAAAVAAALTAAAGVAASGQQLVEKPPGALTVIPDQQAADSSSSSADAAGDEAAASESSVLLLHDVESSLTTHPVVVVVLWLTVALVAVLLLLVVVRRVLRGSRGARRRDLDKRL